MENTEKINTEVKFDLVLLLKEYTLNMVPEQTRASEDTSVSLSGSKGRAQFCPLWAIASCLSQAIP